MLKKFIVSVLAIIVSYGALFSGYILIKNKTNWFDEKTETSSTIEDSSSPSEDTSAPSEDVEEVDYEQKYNELIQQTNGVNLIFDGYEYELAYSLEASDLDCFIISFDNNSRLFVYIDEYEYQALLDIVDSNKLPSDISISELYQAKKSDYSQDFSLLTFYRVTGICQEEFNYTLTDISDLGNCEYDGNWGYTVRIREFELSEEKILFDLEIIVSSNYDDLQTYLKNNR